MKGMSDMTEAVLDGPMHDSVDGLRAVSIEMQDGTSLVCDVYFPRDMPSKGVPTIIERTPYDRRRLGLVARARVLVDAGYAVVLQDVRGRYASEGDWNYIINPNHETQDGVDTLDWIARQAWSNGRIGSMGFSYSGNTSQAMATAKPRSLEAQYIEDSGYNYWSRSTRINGAFTEGKFFVHALWMALSGREAAEDRSVRSELRLALDEMDKWVRHLPIKRGASPLALAPTYEDWYFAIATEADYSAKWRNPMVALEDYIEQYPDIAALFITSWYGSHPWENFDKLSALRAQGYTKSRLICGPWIHDFGYTENDGAGEAHFGTDASVDHNRLMVRWFDRWLRDIDNGVDRTTAISYFVMGGGAGERGLDGRIQHGGRWQESDAWPPENLAEATLYLGVQGTLAERLRDDDDGVREYVFDPKDPVPTIGGPLVGQPAGLPLIWEGGAWDQVTRPHLPMCHDERPLSARGDVLVYRTEPFETPYEVTGKVIVHLYVSTEALDTDFTVKVIDEYPPSKENPRGLALNLVDSIVRLRYRNGTKVADPVKPNTVYEVQFDGPMTSNVFGIGHRLRIDVSSSNFPQFDVNPNTGRPLGIGHGAVACINTIWHGSAYPSRVEFHGAEH